MNRERTTSPDARVHLPHGSPRLMPLKASYQTRDAAEPVTEPVTLCHRTKPCSQRPSALSYDSQPEATKEPEAARGAIEAALR